MFRPIAKRTAPLCALMLAALTSTAARAQTNEIKVTPVAVSESRFHLLIPTEKKRYYSNSLSVVLRFEGEGIVRATRYGKLTVQPTKTDTGAIVKPRRVFGANRLQNLNRNSFSALGKKLPNNQFEIPIRFELPPRDAKSLSSLKGKVTFGIGKVEKVVIPVSKMKDLVGSNIDNPLLTKLGLTINVAKFSKGPRHSANFKITGKKRDAVLSADLIDPAGKKVNLSSFVFRSFNSTNASVSTSRPLPEGSTVQIALETSRTDTEIEFDFKDIPLK